MLIYARQPERQGKLKEKKNLISSWRASLKNVAA